MAEIRTRAPVGPAVWPGLLRVPRGMHRVAVATDFSLRAEYALARALRLPLSEGATLGLVYVRAAREAQGVRVPVERCLHRSANAARRRLRARADVEVREAVRVGGLVPQLDAWVHEARTELLLVGRPHVRPRQALPEDSTVRALVRGVGTPVLVVVPHPARAWQRPLVAVDFSPDSRRALELTLRLCPPPTCVDVVHVFAPPQGWGNAAQTVAERVWREREAERTARASLLRFLAPYREAGRDFELHVRAGQPLEEVLDEASFLGVDLLAVGMTGPGHSGLVERLLATESDVLVAKQPPA